ncbi:MAG: VWA domain-containing protein [Terrimicrobiaceae bacterium]
MNGLMSFGFGQPWWLLLLPALVWWFRRLGENGPAAAITHSSSGLLARVGRKPSGGSPGRLLRALLVAALALFIIALARPRVPQGEQDDPDTGIEIVLAVDVSGSMDAQDFPLGTKKITRREALLKAISEFVDGRGHDRIGMIGFAGNTYLLSPMTTDGNWIKEVYKLVVLKASTAVGDGLLASVRMLEESQAPSKVVILVTDGFNNAGSNPLDAAEYARKKGVRVYVLVIMNTIHIQTTNLEKNPLAQVATKTGGQYFQAGNTEALIQIYQQIDRMEKRPFEQNKNMLYDELFLWALVPGAFLLLLRQIAAHTFWMRLP